MKKRLFLLPLLGGMLLTGCKITLFGKTFYLFEKNPDAQKDDSKKEDCFEFVPSEMETPYFGEDHVTPQTFEYEGMEFYDRQAYYSSGADALWFFNKWDGNMDSDGKVTESTVFSFISNKTAFSKGIKKVVFTTSEGTGGSFVNIKFGSSAFTESEVGISTKVTASKANTYEVSGDGSKFFVISARNDVGFGLKNLQLSSLKVYFS